MSTSLEISQFEQLFKSNYERLCNLSYKIVGERDTSEDLVQELFIKLWNKRDTLTINEIKSYLNKSIVNTSLNYLKAAKNRRLMTTIDTLPEVGLDITEEQLRTKELQHKIDLAIKKLPPKCQTIFALSRFESMSSKEIADRLEISTKTVDNQIGIALSKLRNELKTYLILSAISILLLYLLFWMLF